MPIDKHAFQRWCGCVREIINREWDPIGDCPDDEYDTYSDKIAGMILNKATDEDLLAYLELVEVDYMGLGRPFDRERGIKVIAALRALDPPPTSK